MSVRTENIGFASEQKPAAAAVKPKTAVENPINALNNDGMLPEKISIPSIDIEAEVLHLGITDNGEMAVPDTIHEVSWFEPGYKPGSNGRAVIAGHVDGVEGPAIFWDLADLAAGDEIIVEGEGRKMTFRVYAMESVQLELADVESVFGYRSSPELVLITCSGTYDFEQGTREERLIVYAELIEE